MCVCFGANICTVYGQWGDVATCLGGLKGMQVDCSAICPLAILGWYLTTCSSAHTHIHTQTHRHPTTHMPTLPHMDLYRRTEAWRAEMKYPSHQPYTNTWRSRPRDRNRTSDHMTLSYTGMQAHKQLNTHTHAHTHCFLSSVFCSFYFPYLSLALAHASKYAYLNVGALKKIKQFFSLSLATSVLASIPQW